MSTVRSYGIDTHSLPIQRLPAQTPKPKFLIPRTGSSFTNTSTRRPMSTNRSRNGSVSEVVGRANQEEIEAPLLAPTEREIDYTRAVLLFLIPAIGGLLFGYEIGATSGAIDSIKSATKSGTDWYDLSSLQEGLVVSSSLLGGMLGSIFAAFAGSALGRKRELLLSSLLYFGGTLVASSATGFLPLCGGRWLYGIGVGLAMHGAPSYIAETSPARLRGLLISAKEGFIVFGILLGYFISFLFVDVESGWRFNYGLALPLVLIFGIGMLFLPDSPRFQLLSGDKEAARESLRRVFGNIRNREVYIEEELELAESVISTEIKSSDKSALDLFRRKNWKPLYITLSVVIFQQATGQPSVLYYAQSILQKANVLSDSSEASTAAVVLGVWKLIVTIFAASKVESLGRRPLLLYGVSGLTLALLILSGSCAMDGAAASWAGVFALLLYVGCYQFSFGPVGWLLVGELFPLEDRNQGVALCTFANFGSNFIVSLLFPVLQNTIGLSLEYLMFASIGLLSLLSIYYTVPETKGKTLEEIEALFDS
eukprot:g8495.t1